MHRILLSRALCKSIAAAADGKTTYSTQAWDGVWKVLLLSTHKSGQLYSSTVNSCQHSEDSVSTHKNDTLNFEEHNPGVNNCEEPSMDSLPKSSRDGKSKRSREFVSPLRPKSSKKIAKGSQSTPNSPPLICLDDIPLPKVKTPANTKKTASLDFIPLPASPPSLPEDGPPLPPPLPTPPPPPSHSEMEEVLNDFFIIDTTSSSTLFPIPLPPHLMSSSEFVPKVSENASTSKTADVVNSVESDPEEISVLYNSDMVLHERLENINLLDKHKNSNVQSTNRLCSSQDDIDVVFEGQWPWVVRSPSKSSKARQKNPLFSGMGSIPFTTTQFRNIHQSTKELNPTTSTEITKPDIVTLDDSCNSATGKSLSTDSKKSFSSQEKQQFLRKKFTPDAQVRSCHHSTSHGLKTIERSPERVLVMAEGSEPDIITLDTQACSILHPSTAEEFISLDSNANKLLREVKNKFTYEPLSRKEKKSKKSRDIQKIENKIPIQQRQSGKGKEPFSKSACRDSSPDIQKVSVVDPDVVEIDYNFSSSSTSMAANYEVIDVCNVENGLNERALEEMDVNLASEEMDIVDVCESESERESLAGSSDHEEDLDVSNVDFVALQKVQLKNLENTEIDLDDEVLEKREELEKRRKWYMTNLGNELLLSGKQHNRGGTLFSVLSYNVLAQQLLEDNKYLYKNCDKRHLDWGYRWALLQHEIDDLDPDVLLLQEVQASHYYSHYLPWLTFRGYEGLYKKRTGQKCDGCAIFYKTNKFSLVEHCTVEYFQPKAQNVLDRDNVGIIAKLAPAGNTKGAEVCLATTHFLYNPRRHDVKLAQAVLLMTELDRICYKGEKHGQTQYCPAILTGDFNAEPYTSMLDFVRNGRLRYEGMSSRTLTQYGSTYPILGQELIPQTLGITDRCQHAVLAQSRFVEKTTGPLFSLADKRKLEESLIRFSNSDRTNSRMKDVRSSFGGPCPSGWFSHDFNFKSVYSHYMNRAPEATTFHNKWTSVDYIFYSRVYSQDRAKQVEGPLKLLGKYGLLLGPEASKFAPLPSAVCPSDHFPLAAQFLLKD